MNITEVNKGCETITVCVSNELGLHLRPASRFVQKATTYVDCSVTLVHNGQEVNGKSIMGVIMLAAEKGTEIRICVSGPNAAEVARELGHFFDEELHEG